MPKYLLICLVYTEQAETEHILLVSFRWSIFSVKSQTSTSGSSELCEAPSVSEDLGAMGQQVCALRARLDAFLEDRNEDGEALHKE
jgi:hypothetical protein